MGWGINASNMHISFNINAFRSTVTKDLLKESDVFWNFFFIKQSYHNCHTVFAVFFSRILLPIKFAIDFFFKATFKTTNPYKGTTLSSFLVLFTVSWTVLCTNTVTCYFFVSWKCVKCSTCRLFIISLISIYLRSIISSLFYYSHKR